MSAISRDLRFCGASSWDASSFDEVRECIDAVLQRAELFAAWWSCSLSLLVEWRSFHHKFSLWWFEIEPVVSSVARGETSTIRWQLVKSNRVKDARARVRKKRRGGTVIRGRKKNGMKKWSKEMKREKQRQDWAWILQSGDWKTSNPIWRKE